MPTCPLQRGHPRVKYRSIGGTPSAFWRSVFRALACAPRSSASLEDGSRTPRKMPRWVGPCSLATGGLWYIEIVAALGAFSVDVTGHSPPFIAALLGKSTCALKSSRPTVRSQAQAGLPTRRIRVTFRPQIALFFSSIGVLNDARNEVRNEKSYSAMNPDCSRTGCCSFHGRGAAVGESFPDRVSIAD
jgi:hypothetical protein